MRDPFLDRIDSTLDDKQSEACCAEGDIVVVAAGAGSGKTHVLSNRFAWLVATGRATAQKILTLTFTKKAAAEMYGRIYKNLSELSSDTRVTKEEHDRIAKAIFSFSNVHIQTLDSYCSYVVKQCAGKYGIRQDFSTGSAESSRTVKNLAYDFVVEHQDDEAIKAVCGTSSLQSIANSIFADAVLNNTSIVTSISYPKNDFFSCKFTKQSMEIEDEFIKVLKDYNTAIGDISNGLSNITDHSKPRSGFVSAVNNLITIANNNKLEFQKGDINDIHKRADISRKIEYIAYATNSISLRGNIQDNAISQAKDLVKNYRDGIFPCLQSLAEFIIHYDHNQQLYKLLDEFLVLVNNSKHRTGGLTFKDVSELALYILQNDKDMRNQEHEAYDTIMIDEFQDNNADNRSMIEQIGRPVFYVGDEKQSIYKFRGADVSVFNNLKSQASKKIHMTYNYRSNKELLQSFNQIFGGYQQNNSTTKKIEPGENDQNAKIAPENWIFPENDNGDSYKACFTDESCADKSSTDTKKDNYSFVSLFGEKVPVHVVMSNDAVIKEFAKENIDEYLSSTELTANYIADEIERLVYLEASKSVNYNDIAILDGTRTHRRELLEALNRKKIPYLLDEFTDLFDEAPINDIYSFLRLCVYPSDENTYAVVLRSPFCGLDEYSMEAVIAISLKDREQSGIISFNKNDNEEIEKTLAPEQLNRYYAGQKLYDTFSVLALQQPLVKTMTSLWYETGYCFETMRNDFVSVSADQYDFLFELARTADTDGKTLSWFVDQLAEKKKRFGGKEDADIKPEDVTYPREDSNAIQIMTIHKSKGRQFNYVFTLGCTNKRKTEQNKEKIFFSKEDGISIKYTSGINNYFFKKIQEEETKKNDAEFRRLIYVAFTRARKQVYIIGDWNRNGDKKKKETDPNNSSPVEKLLEKYYPGSCSEGGILTYALGKTIYEQNAPFDFLSLKPVDKKTVYSINQPALSSYDDMYKNAKIVTPITPKINHFSPSGFEEMYDDTVRSQHDDTYKELAELFADETANFKANDFGTLIHSYLENNVNGIDSTAFEPDVILFKSLSKQNIEQIKKTCHEIVTTFNNSSIGQQLTDCKKSRRFYKAEYAFKLCLEVGNDKNIITGSIDLVYQDNDGKYEIIDYKSDRCINNEKYYGELYCYKKALAALLSVKEDSIVCSLYYLRFNQIENITVVLSKLNDEFIIHKINGEES